MKNKVKDILNKLDIYEPPIQIEKIANFFSLKIIYYPEFPDSISGTMAKEEMLIGINSNHHPNRQRFTIAHELGHYILGHDDLKIIDDTFDKNTDKEKEANKFAAELLIPEYFLKKDIKEKSWDIPSLSQRYKVSEQVMTIRIMNLNLLDKINPAK